MSDYKRLHPISAISHFLKQLKELIPAMIIFFAMSHSGHRGFWSDEFPLIAGGAISVFTLLSGIVRWYRFTYRLVEGQLRIEHGLFIKKKSYIPYEKIQSINISAGVLQRPFGLVKVKVETAGKRNEAETVLSAIKKVEAGHIQHTITESKQKMATIKRSKTFQNGTLHPELVFEITRKELFIMSATSGRAGVILSAVLAFYSQTHEYLPYDRLYKNISGLFKTNAMLIGALILILFLFIWLFSIVITFFKYHQFTVRKSEKDLIITRGLLEKQQTVLPLERIQTIRISENPLRELLGFATVFIESAGGNHHDKYSRNMILIPLVKKNRISAILKEIIEDYHYVYPLKRPPIRAVNNYILKEWIKGSPIIIISLAVNWKMGLLAALLLLPYGGGLGYLRFQAAGWGIDDAQLTLRYRWFLKHTLIMKKHKANPWK